MLEKLNRKRVVNQTLDWASELGAIAGPLRPNDTRASWLHRAARRAGLSYRQCSSIFYGQVRDPKFSIASKILSAADQARLEESRRDAQKIVGIYEGGAARLEAIDADFHREQINALVSAARILRGLDSAGT